MHTVVASMHIYPVKSLGGFSVRQAKLTDRGLEHDRRWMLVDADGKFLSQREVPVMACLHCAPADKGFSVTDVRTGGALDIPWALLEGEAVQARVWNDEVELLLAPASMHQWFSDALKRHVHLAYMPDSTVRPTDPLYAKARVALNDAFPALIISQASLDELNTRLAMPVPMDRFRPNLVIAGGEAFQEDRWKDLVIGEARFKSVKPCARCAVTTTDQRTGVRSQEPLRTLAAYRSVGNKVLFGINAVFDAPGMVRAGDPVRPVDH
ncbi:MAG: MOSC domain-containing protein [Flavobacteriales bacterium]|nr:MOSC domain-containing protein [Flavobacteriales bacterium]